jgi:hypothetical protein
MQSAGKRGVCVPIFSPLFKISSLRRTVARTLKRGEGRPLVSLEELLAREHADFELTRTLSPDRLYERRWALTLLEQVLARLGEEYRVAGSAALFEQLKQMRTDEPDRPSQAKIAQELSMTENAVKQAFHRLRRRTLVVACASSACFIGTMPMPRPRFPADSVSICVLSVFLLVRQHRQPN